MNRTEKDIKTESEKFVEFISLPQKLLDKAIVVLVHKVLLHQNYFVRAY